MIIYKRINKCCLHTNSFLRKILELNRKFLEKWLNSGKICGINVLCPFIEADNKTKEEIRINADAIVNGQYRIFNKVYDFSHRIPWNSDFESGFNWPKGVFFRKYIQVELTNNADVKYPRELSRFHHALILGQAYLLTKDKSYYMKFKQDVLDWIEENPFMKSINWGCTQDVSIRAVNWLWAIGFFAEELSMDHVFKKTIDRSLYQHGFFIYMYPEKSIYNNHNHYISDLVGQIYLGLYFKKDKHAQNWLNWGIEELYREIRYQILPTGPSYEKSINYHRFVTEMIFSALILLQKERYEIPQDILFRVEKMLEFIMYYIKPDGDAPIIGDQDDARLHPFSLISNLDHRYLLCLGAVFFQRGDFKYHAKRFYLDCSLLLGREAYSQFDDLEADTCPLSSKAFPDAGFYIIRDQDNYMFINNSGKSRYNELGGGTHTHSDLLSFELCMNKKTFLVDPGSYVYSGNPDLRMHFRSTKMHNTLTVDDQNQNTLERENLWDFSRNVLPKTTKWSEEPDKVIFEGEYSGVLTSKLYILHQRRIEYNKISQEFCIQDKVQSEGKHKITLYLHFDWDIEVQIKDNIVRTNCSDGNNIEISFNSDTPFGVKSSQELVSKAYRFAKPAAVIRLETEAKLPITIMTKIKRINE
ncbi:MAG TPA: alginate lyase family protein [Candidatus Cloacimonadota bacterium]|nr:alginate lyase family protein [Candidatus Cloacimonadota bacterium]